MTDFSLHRRATDCIIQGYLTNSKRPECFVKNVYPTHIKRGQGCWLWDHKGKKYLDFITGLGTNLLGYGNTQVSAAVAAEVHNGVCHSLATHHEVEAAEALKAVFPFVSHFKFLKTGSDACSAAIKIARAKTGKTLVLSDGYHGHHDAFVSLTPPAFGVPPHEHIQKFTGEISDKVAAVIIEPVVTDWSPARIKYLQDLRDECTKKGVILIFDEIINGLRFTKLSVSNATGIHPDIICLGKAMANGMPLAAVGVTTEVNRDLPEVFISSTYAGDILSLVACKSVLHLLQTKHDIDWLWKHGQAFLDEFNGLWDKIQIVGYPTRGVFTGDPLAKALFWQEAVKAGMLFGASWWLNFPAAEEYKNAMGAIRAIMDRIKTGGVTLDGEMPASPYAQKVRAG